MPLYEKKKEVKMVPKNTLYVRKKKKKVSLKIPISFQTIDSHLGRGVGIDMQKIGTFSPICSYLIYELRFFMISKTRSNV